MRENKYILKNSLEAYTGKILQGNFCWESLSIFIHIGDIINNKVKLIITFTIARDKYLKRFRRIAMNNLIQSLEEDLNIKKKYLREKAFGGVKKTTSFQSDGIKFCANIAAYEIPSDLYNELEALAKIDNRSIY